MSKGLITIFGGSGFIGRYAARECVKAGYRVRIACRRPGLAGDVRLAGAPGWVDIVQANIRDTDSVQRALQGADAVVNLVGILNESGKQSFQTVQAEGAANIAKAVHEAGIERFIHVSAIGADASSASAYGRTKGEAEAAIRAIMPEAVILRPSIVFGPEDEFFNRFATLARVSPALPAIGGGHTKLQPIYAGDVAKAIAAAIETETAKGQTYELGGPNIYTFNEIYDYILKTVCRKRFKVPLPFGVAKLIGVLLKTSFRFIPPLVWLFGPPPITDDQVEMLKADNIVDPESLSLADLGLHQPISVESIVPGYLWRHRPQGEFTQTGDI